MNKVKSRSYSYLSTCFFTMVPFALVACRPPIHSYDQRIVQLAFGLFCRPRITRNANKKQEGTGSSLSPNKSKLGRPFVSYVIEPLPRIALTPKAFMKADHKWNYYNNVQCAQIVCPTGNGRKLSKSQACCLAQQCLAAAEFLSISCGANYLRALYFLQYSVIQPVRRPGWVDSNLLICIMRRSFLGGKNCHVMQLSK